MEDDCIPPTGFVFVGIRAAGQLACTALWNPSGALAERLRCRNASAPSYTAQDKLLFNVLLMPGFVQVFPGFDYDETTSYLGKHSSCIHADELCQYLGLGTWTKHLHTAVVNSLGELTTPSLKDFMTAFEHELANKHGSLEAEVNCLLQRTTPRTFGEFQACMQPVNQVQGLARKPNAFNPTAIQSPRMQQQGHVKTPNRVLAFHSQPAEQLSNANIHERVVCTGDFAAGQVYTTVARPAVPPADQMHILSYHGLGGISLVTSQPVQYQSAPPQSMYTAGGTDSPRHFTALASGPSQQRFGYPGNTQTTCVDTRQPFVLQLGFKGSGQATVPGTAPHSPAPITRMHGYLATGAGLSGTTGPSENLAGPHLQLHTPDGRQGFSGVPQTHVGPQQGMHAYPALPAAPMSTQEPYGGRRPQLAPDDVSPWPRAARRDRSTFSDNEDDVLEPVAKRRRTPAPASRFAQPVTLRSSEEAQDGAWSPGGVRLTGWQFGHNQCDRQHAAVVGDAMRELRGARWPAHDHQARDDADAEMLSDDDEDSQEPMAKRHHTPAHAPRLAQSRQLRSSEESHQAAWFPGETPSAQHCRHEQPESQAAAAAAANAHHVLKGPRFTSIAPQAEIDAEVERAEAMNKAMDCQEALVAQDSAPLPFWPAAITRYRFTRVSKVDGGQQGQVELGITDTGEKKAIKTVRHLLLCGMAETVCMTTNVLRRAAVRELKASSQVYYEQEKRRCPYVVFVDGYFALNGKVSMVLDWVDGTQLSKTRAKSAQEVQRWHKNLVDGLEYLHKQGKGHFDLSRSNIIITKRRDPVIIDLGSVQDIDNSGNEHTKLGRDMLYTPRYADPSMMRHHNRHAEPGEEYKLPEHKRDVANWDNLDPDDDFEEDGVADPNYDFSRESEEERAEIAKLPVETQNFLRLKLSRQTAPRYHLVAEADIYAVSAVSTELLFEVLLDEAHSQLVKSIETAAFPHAPPWRAMLNAVRGQILERKDVSAEEQQMLQDLWSALQAGLADNYFFRPNTMQLKKHFKMFR